MEDSKRSYCKVCVTGGAGYIGSSLIKKLMDKGNYIVHATLRNLGDNAKVGLLKSIPGAESRLILFEADIYEADQFAAAIRDCQCVFHIATPLSHTHNSKYKDTTEAAVEGVKSIAMSCIKSGTVKRLVYTASVVAASPLESGRNGYKEIMDENCWTPLDIPLLTTHLQDYTTSKTQAEREVLSFDKVRDLEVVSVAFGLIGGETLLGYVPGSTSVVVSQLSDKESARSNFEMLRNIEDLCAKIPILHIEDACEALLFCMEKDSISGRFLCASDFVSSAEIAQYYEHKYPEIEVKHVCADVPERTVRWASMKLMDEGFTFTYDLKMILDDSVKCARRLGVI